MGRALQGRRPRRTGRPLVTAARLRQPTSPAVVEQVDRAAPPAPDRQADRQGRRRLAGHRQPRAQARRPEPAQGPRAGRAGAPLRTRAARRADPHRHQEARPVRPGRPPHHRRPQGAEQRTSRGEASAGSSSMSASTTPRASPSPDHAGREGEERRRLPQGRRRLLRQPRRHGRARHDRQRLLLQSLRLRRACKGLELKHIRTRPYTPKTNGKAERFIQTALREWAYAMAYNTSDERAQQLRRGCTATIGIARTAA